MDIHPSELVDIGVDAAGTPGISWQKDLAAGAHSLADLVDQGFVSRDIEKQLTEGGLDHRICVSRYYLSLIDPNNLKCPIRAQAIPRLAELETFPWEETDPIGDDIHRVGDILVHRYPNRVLLFPTHACPLSCRYCFRKVAINDGPLRLHKALPEALDYLRTQPQVSEVILSGGDPLLLVDRTLRSLVDAIDGIPSIQTIRLHSRAPATLPSRITTECVQTLSQSRAQMILVTHFNHPTELSPSARKGLEMLRNSGMHLANQSVLLKGVNDCPKTLAELCQGLLKLNVRPYYLHHLDPAPGTAHYRVSIEDGLQIYRRFCGLVSGLARPRYVMEYPGGGGKMDVDSRAIRPVDDDGRYELTAPLDGRTMIWHDPARASADGSYLKSCVG